MSESDLSNSTTEEPIETITEAPELQSSDLEEAMAELSIDNDENIRVDENIDRQLIEKEVCKPCVTGKLECNYCDATGITEVGRECKVCKGTGFR